MINDELKVRITGKNELGPPMRAAVGDVRAFSGSADAAGLSVGKLASGMFLGVTAAAAFTAAIRGIASATLGSIKTGVEFNATVEQSRIGIAALLNTYGQFSNSQGKALTGTAAFNAALSESERII